jgi:putative endopeptidase
MNDQRVSSYSELLSKEFHDATLEYNKSLGLVSGDAPEWKQGVDFVQKTVPMLVGKLYVERYFDNEQRKQIEDLVQEIRTSAKEVITTSPILSTPTKERAIKKLDMMSFNIGYPDTWRDYSELEVSDDELVENFKNTSRADLADNYKKVLKPVDRSEWERSPSEVNAFYDPTQNKFVLLAGILHPPFYDPTSGAASRYGGLGFVVGHEIGHAFDDSGSQFDEEGNLGNWWTDEDRKAFNKVKKAYIHQANTFEILPGVHLNGELQIGEILGDATGAKLALSAFNKVIERDKLDKKGAHQAFFRQLARVWREKYRPEFAKLLIATDPHPAGKFRTDGIVSNMDAFHDAFATKPGDGMYKKPSDRKVIW